MQLCTRAYWHTGLLRLSLLLSLAWLGLGAHAAHAQCPPPSGGFTPLEEETLAVAATAIGLTPAKYQPPGSTASMAVIQVKAANITYRLKGTPASGDGADVGAGSSFPICGIDSIRAFRVMSPGSASLFITYYKGKNP